MEIREVLKHLPHRYPFILVDRVIDFEAGKFIHACKNVSVNEPFFQGHFPGHPVMPGVLIMESLAQASGILSFKSLGILPDDTHFFYFVGIDKARFKKRVIPGDQLHLHVEIKRIIRNVCKFGAIARVDGEVVAEAELMCARSES